MINGFQQESNRQWGAAMQRAIDDERRSRLHAIQRLHSPQEDGPYCTACAQIWPCPTDRLADLARPLDGGTA